MKFLVTGATGFVGGRFVKRLLDLGHSVKALVRPSSNRRELARARVEVCVADFQSGKGLDEALDGVECVQHIAGVTKARTIAEYELGNAEVTRVLCQAIARRQSPPRLVFCSSLAAAGPSTLTRPRREDDEPAPVSTYGRSKLAAEVVVRAFAEQFECVVLRPPVVYGPGDLTNVPPILKMSRLGVFVRPGLTEKRLSFIHVDDLCDALLLASTRGRTLAPDDHARGVYFVADPQTYTYDDFFHTVHRSLGRGRPRVLPLPQAVGFAVGLTNELAGRVLDQVPILNRDKALEMTYEAWTCSPARAQAEIDFTPAHDLEAGIKHTMGWYRTEGLV